MQWIVTTGEFMDFEVYHLMEEGESIKALALKVKKAFRKPDESVLMHYCLNQPHIEECRTRHKISIKDHYIEKCILAKQILDAGGYVKVADVTADNMIDAFVKTTSINQRWFINPAKGVKVLGKTLRSTQSYDLMRWDQANYLIMPLGYLNIESGELFELKWQ